MECQFVLKIEIKPRAWILNASVRKYSKLLSRVAIENKEHIFNNQISRKM